MDRKEKQMVNHVILGITGRKRHGKDSVANVLVRSFHFKRYSFATLLKEVCRTIFLLSYDQVHGEAKDAIDIRWNSTPRALMQAIGTELFRDTLPKVLPLLNMGSDTSIWCRCFRLWIESFSQPQRIVISDVRFADEAATIRSLGGTLVRVVRPTFMNDGDVHASETESASIVVDHTIINDTDLNELSVKTCTVVRQILPATGFEIMQVMHPRGLVLDDMPRCVEDLVRAIPDVEVEETFVEKTPNKRIRKRKIPSIPDLETESEPEPALKKHDTAE